MHVYYVYILVSKKFPKTYVGISDDPKRRLSEHNKGESYYTKRYMPWKIFYIEEYINRVEAHKREKYFKSATGRKFIKILFNNIPG